MKGFAGFVLRLTTGIARDQDRRRQAISALLVVVLAMLALGVFALWTTFTTHPLFFALYWLACGWITICVALLAAYDLLMVIRRGREERAAARRRILGDDH